MIIKLTAKMDNLIQAIDKEKPRPQSMEKTGSISKS